MIKTILGYNIVEGVSEQEYEDWLFGVHAPDILANPFVDRLVFNRVLRPVERTSAGSPPAGAGQRSFYRIAEMHFADEEAYAKYLAWFAEHPVAEERGPAGRTDFGFYVLAESTEVGRDG